MGRRELRDSKSPAVRVVVQQPAQTGRRGAARRGHFCYDTTATTTAAADSVSTDQRPTRQLCYEPHVSVREAMDPPLNIT